MLHFKADDGEQIHLKIDGAGPPLIMLHGWTADHREWTPFIHALGAKTRIFRWDARGHGGHALTQATAPTVQRMAQDLHNLLEHYAIEKAVIVGHSMGALTLWQYIRDFGTQRLQKICIIDQSPKLLTDDTWPYGIYGNFDAGEAKAFLAKLNDDFAESVLQLIAYGLNTAARTRYLENAIGWQKSRTLLQSLAPAPLIACWESLTAADYRDILRLIDIPTLLIYGGSSNFYVPETGKYVASKIASASLHIYEEMDHSPHLWQRDRFLSDLSAFIEQAAKSR